MTERKKPTDKQIWELYNKLKSSRKVASRLGIGKSTVNDRLAKIRHQLEHSGIDPSTSKAIASRVTDTEKRYARYVITSAQNATPVRKSFFKALLKYCKHNCAELMVIPYRYKNPTSLWNENNVGEEWWSSDVLPYLMNERIRIEDCNLKIMGDIKIQPTATDPLTGFDAFSKGDSAIYGHPTLRLKTVATPKHTLPKILASTGAVTEPNYTDSKAGKKAENLHRYSAQVIEVDRETGVFHIRQIIAVNDGSFIDLDKHYCATEVTPAPPAAALIGGDTHAMFVDEDVIKATYTNNDSIVNSLRCEQIVWHDVLDFYARNHHERGNFIKDYAKHNSDFHNVEAEVDITFALIDRCTQPCVKKNVVVRSNHDEALDRWVKEADFKQDPENAVFYLKTALAILENMNYSQGKPNTIDPLEYWARTKLKNYHSSLFLRRDEPYTIMSTDVSNHGDLGPNGSKGSLNNFTHIGGDVVIGHSHSPGIKGNVHQTGLSATYYMDYARGLSSWLQTHCVIYANGTKTLINVIDGEWRI